jgi:hypothetical protein
MMGLVSMCMGEGVGICVFLPVNLFIKLLSGFVSALSCVGLSVTKSLCISCVCPPLLPIELALMPLKLIATCCLSFLG